MDEDKNDDQDVGASITVNSEGELLKPCGLESSDLKNAEHGGEKHNQQNTDHNYINNSMMNTNAVPTVTGTDPMVKALIDQIQVLINSLLTMNSRLQDRDSTPSHGSEYSIMPNFLTTLPEFDGRTDKQTAADWVAAIEGVSKLHRWPDAFKIETARSKMTGPASHWYVGKTFNSWSDFVRQFKNTFIGSTFNTVERMKRMLNRSQGSSETVADYFHHKARLCRELELPFSETKQQIAAGLRSWDLCYYLLARHHVDEGSLCNDLMSFARINDTRSQYFKKNDLIASKPQHSSKEKSDSCNLKTNSSQMNPTIENTADRVNVKKFPKLPPQDDKDEPLCFNCSKYGHVSRYCLRPKKPKCTR